MSTSVIDYFAVLGRGEGPLQCDPFTNLLSDEKNVITASEVLDEAITDIAVLTADQSVPDDTWCLLVTTAEDNQVDAPFLAVRRYIDSKRLDYITDIKLVLPNEHIPDGYELISGAHTGSDAPSLLGRGFLAVKRANATDLRYWKSDPIIDDIAFVKKSANEELPEQYLEIEVLPAAQQYNHLTGRHAADVSIVFHRRTGLGLCDLAYQSATVDRYPRQDHDKIELAVTGLPMFAFPNGMRLTLAEAGQFPLPLFFTFVFTDADGKNFYVACLQFYEPVTDADLQDTFRQVHGEGQEVAIPADKRIYCPKVICTISQWPFYRAMRRFLRQLYSLSFSTLQCPLEYYIAAVVHQVPFPLEDGRPFHVTLDVALISHTSKAMAPIEFKLPSATSFPLMDVDFAGPLRCLSVEHLLAVYTLMLRESKLLFVCESNTMLTEVMETLRALLFPLTWSSCFVPRLPVALTGLLQAPGGFMIGVHVPSDASTSTITGTNSRTAAYLRHLHSCRSLVAGTYVVDLTANTVAQYSGRSFDKLDSGRVEGLLKLLPFGPKFRLQAVLRKLAHEFSVGPQAINLGEFDSAFELQSAEGLANAEKWESFPTLQVRDAFFAFLIDFLGDYSRYILPPSEDLAADSYRTFQEEFAIAQYVDLADKASRSTTELLLETQMFSALVQRRAEGRQPSLVFFERAGALVRELGLSAGGHGWSQPSRPASEVLELPLPIYGLVAADAQWASMGPHRQQQLRVSANSARPGDAAPHNTHTQSTATALSGRHHLNYLSTGTMNVLRSGALPLPYNPSQPVLNQKLDDLLTMWEILSSSSVPTTREKSATLDTDVSEVERARSEINQDLSALHLDNAAFGPLIIPGPTRAYSGDEGKSAESPGRNFSYHTGWPVLNDSYMNQALAKAVSPALAAIRALRRDYELQTGKDVQLIVRPPGRRLAFEQHGKLINPVQVAASEEVAAVVSVLMDISVLALTTLSVRTMHKSKPSSDVLQILGVLAQLDEWELLPCLSESAWRAVLVACANAGGDLMRRVCVIVYQLVPGMTGQAPDSLTYGCYLRALAAKKRHLGNLEPVSLGKSSKSSPALFSTPDPVDAVVDAYLYLEEMGSTWYIQRSALQGQTLNTAQLNAHSSSNRSSTSPLSSVTGAVTKTLTLGKRINIPLSFRSSDQSPGDTAVGAGSSAASRPVSIKPEATKLTSGQFSLADGPGMLVYHRPITLLALYPPRKVREFTSLPEQDKPTRPQPAALSAELLNRMDQLYAGALPHIRRAVSMSPLAPAALPTRDGASGRSRNDSTAANTATNSGEASPINNNSSSNRIAALSRRFFTTKKTESTSPLPGSSEHHIELTDNSAGASGAPSPTPPGMAAPASPNPFGWAKKLRPAMFFGSSPQATAAGTGSVSGATPATPFAAAPPAGGSLTPRRDGTADIELKVLSATLNFDDEEDEDGEERDSADYTATAAAVAAGGGRGAAPPDWAVLPTPAQSMPTLAPPSAVEEEPATAAARDTVQSESAASTDAAPLIDLESMEVPIAPTAEEVVSKSEDVAQTLDSAIEQAKEDLLDLDGEAAVVVADESQLFRDSDQTSETSDNGSSQADRADPADQEPAKPKSVDVVTLQAQLLQAFEAEYAAQGKAVGIHSASPCPHCGFTMLDEEVLSRWCHGHGYESHIRGNQRSPHARDMVAVHSVTCKQCAEEFAPQLHVSCYVRDTTGAEEESSAKASDTRSAVHVPITLARQWTEHVSYLSPFGLRYLLESVLLQHGHAALTTSWLHTHQPALLWGILFYCARVHLPSGLHHVSAEASNEGNGDGDQSFQHPIVVAWRESTVRALASRVLTGKSYDFLAVRDLFPECSDEDAARLEQEVVPALDGSPASMRIAMLEFCKCESVMIYGQKAGFSVARLLNAGLLMVSYAYHKSSLVTPRRFDTLADLDKDPPYEKIFVDAIKCVLSDADFEQIGASESELLAACASHSAVVVRNTLGFLF